MNIAWTDANNDGLLDAYISVRDSDPLPPKQSQPAPDVLLRGEGEFRFLDVSVQLGAIAERSGHAFASAWLDVDQDGDLDHYVANDHGDIIVPNVLFLREGPDDAPTYREAAADFSLDIEVNGMGVAVGDVDGDGWDEIGVSDTASFVLMSTRPNLRAVDVTTAWELQPRTTEGLASWAMEFADFDHDADLDLFVAWGWKEYDVPEVNKDDLWMWEDGTFSDRSDLLGFGGQATGRTVLPIDLDADGSLELISTSIVGSAAIQKRPCPDGSWLQVTVNLAGRNSDGLGTLVEVETPDGIQRRRLGVGSTGLHSAREPTAPLRFGQRGVRRGPPHPAQRRRGGGGLPRRAATTPDRRLALRAAHVHRLNGLLPAIGQRVRERALELRTARLDLQHQRLAFVLQPKDEPLLAGLTQADRVQHVAFEPTL